MAFNGNGQNAAFAAGIEKAVTLLALRAEFGSQVPEEVEAMLATITAEP